MIAMRNKKKYQKNKKKERKNKYQIKEIIISMSLATLKDFANYLKNFHVTYVLI